MLGVLADNHNFAFSLDYLALIANFLNGRLYFHFDSTIPFICFLLGTPSNASLGQIVYRHLNGNLVTGEDSYIVHSEFTRYVSSNYMLVRELDLEGCIGQSLNYDTLKLNYIILRHFFPPYN